MYFFMFITFGIIIQLSGGRGTCSVRLNAEGGVVNVNVNVNGTFQLLVQLLVNGWLLVIGLV